MRVNGERATRTARAAVALVAIPAVAFVVAAATGCTRQTDKAVPRIGFLSSVPSTISTGLQEGLRELGYVEGRNIAVEWRYTDGNAERIPRLAAELVGLKPDLIVTTSGEPSAAAKAATTTIPIVAVAVGDPVRAGLVASLARPGGNVTGLANLVSTEFSGKMLGLLHDAVPAASRVAILMNPSNPDHPGVMSSDLPPVARRLGLTLIPVEVSAASELDAAFGQATRLRADAILVLGDPVVYVNRARIAELAVRQRLPALYFFRENVEAGGLMSYGPSLHDLGRRAATYVDKILKGARPADLPMEQPVKFDLVINRRAAAALGLTIPPALLRQAEQVIE
ncbi:MAG: ABC transporter substrate-binding protein [Betaproteobacteria bacterium]|nr:ABC transporter substrate-binding protein [Betaproteobacteria bacterium]MDH5286810.1 ABC transporter substrate-binding protein [Betaproteobacteria bacterium]